MKNAIEIQQQKFENIKELSEAIISIVDCSPDREVAIVALNILGKGLQPIVNISNCSFKDSIKENSK